MRTIEERRKQREVRERRRSLLLWASSVTGLPLEHVSQVQNGAVFCQIISVICDFELGSVNYTAQEECEVLANYRLLQTVAKAGKVQGLNHKAKLSNWGRLAEYSADTWKFLDILQNCFALAGLGDYQVEIEAEATPPPAPLSSNKRIHNQLSEKTNLLEEKYKFLDQPQQFFYTKLPSLQPLKYDSEKLPKLKTTSAKTRPSEKGALSAAEPPKVLASSEERGYFGSETVEKFFERNSSGASTVFAKDPVSPLRSLSTEAAVLDMALRLEWISSPSASVSEQNASEVGNHCTVKASGLSKINRVSIPDVFQLPVQ